MYPFTYVESKNTIKDFSNFFHIARWEPIVMPDELQECSLTWMYLIVSDLGLGLDIVLISKI